MKSRMTRRLNVMLQTDSYPSLSCGRQSSGQALAGRFTMTVHCTEQASLTSPWQEYHLLLTLARSAGGPSRLVGWGLVQSAVSSSPMLMSAAPTSKKACPRMVLSALRDRALW